MISADEYKTLREEIVHSYTIVDSSRNILYITVAYILTFATTKDTPFLYLLPFAVIIPVYLVAINYTFDMYRIGTYIMIFGETESSDLRWETRQYRLNRQPKDAMPRQAKTFHIPYIFLGFVCSVLFFSSIDYSNLSAADLFSFLLGMILTMILLFIYIYYHDMISVQDKYIEGWQRVLKEEGTSGRGDHLAVLPDWDRI